MWAAVCRLNDSPERLLTQLWGRDEGKYLRCWKMSLSDKELSWFLKQIDRTIGIRNLLRMEASSEAIMNYYTQCHPYYRKYHSERGAMHLGLDFSPGDPDSAGPNKELEQQAFFINRRIRSSNAKRVLEIGCGKGFNSIHLACDNPRVHFVGIDLTPAIIELARKNSQHLTNTDFMVGNYDDLLFEKESFDLVFGVETLCYSENLNASISKLYCVLKPGGTFILFEGYAKNALKDANQDTGLAVKLLHRTIRCRNIFYADECKSAGQDAGFRKIHTRDLTGNIVPNLMTLHSYVKRLFRFPLRVKFMLYLRMVTKPLLITCVPMLLLPALVEGGYCGYYRMEMIK